MSVFVAVVGLPGSGKSIVCDYLRNKKGFQFIRFGQITLDLAKERWGTVNEEKERIIREKVRKEHGMAAYAVLNLKKFQVALSKGNLVGDDLMSYEEYTYLKEKFGERLVLLAVVAGRGFRYPRLTERARANDRALRWRSFTLEEAQSRDLAQLININQGPSIAMADYHILNQKNIEEVEGQVEEFLVWLEKRRGLEL